MENIKFRLWDKDDNVMRGWEEMIILKERWDSFWSVGYKINKAITKFDHEQVLMQCTSRKDKNGIEIYEGDIVKVMDSSLAVVEYCKKRTAFCLKDFIDETDYWLLCQYETIEVIGNIYEDSELN